MNDHTMSGEHHLLTFVQPSVWRRKYELHRGEQTIGTMVFPSLFKRELRVESGGMCWSLEWKGVFKPMVVVRRCDEKKNLAAIPLKRAKGIYLLKLPKYKSARLKVNIWKSEFVLTTTMNAMLCTLTLKQVPRFGGEIKLDPRAEMFRHFPWLLYLVVFISLMSRQNNA